MATYTVVVKSVCPGGEHVTLTVKRDGAVVRDFPVTKTEILGTDLNWETVLPFFLREVIKHSGATTMAQAKAAVEAASWVF
jgi:hypothetical protein